MTAKASVCQARSRAAVQSAGKPPASASTPIPSNGLHVGNRASGNPQPSSLFLQLEASDALARFYYPPVGAVTISYPESAVRDERLVNGKLNGFGQLHPRSQGVVTLGECSLTGPRTSRHGFVLFSPLPFWARLTVGRLNKAELIQGCVCLTAFA